MKFELLDILSKVSLIGSSFLGLFLIVISRRLIKEFREVFPKKVATVMVAFTVSIIWSLAALGLLVILNTDMQEYIAITNDSTPDATISFTTNIESRAFTYVDPQVDEGTDVLTDVSTLGNGYKTTSLIKSKAEVIVVKEETKSEKKQKIRIHRMVSSISVSLLNVIFTIVLSLAIMWNMFMATCFFYNKKYVLKVKE